MIKEIISVVNQKGGVGKTTTCINLAASLAKAKRDVLLIDLDPQSNATRGCGIGDDLMRASLNDVLMNTKDIDESIAETEFGFSIIPSTPDLTESEVRLLSMDEKEYHFKSLISRISDSFHYILIDCPPSLNILTVSSLTASNSLLIPVQCEFFALQGLSELVKTVDTISTSNNPNLVIKGIIRTMYDPRNNLSQDVSNQLKKFFKDKLYKTKIPRNITLAESPSHGLPVLNYDPHSKGSISYMSLAGEIIKQENS